MEIVVNHVTRMREDRICVAGIDLATGNHIRPVTPATHVMTRSHLRSEGGLFGPGAVVELGPVEPFPSAPEVEDHRFSYADAEAVMDFTDEDYLEALQLVAVDAIDDAFGPHLEEIRPGKFAIPQHHGERSLAVVSAHKPRIEVSFGKLYLNLGDGHPSTKLQITDARMYDAAAAANGTISWNPNLERVRDVNCRLGDGRAGYVMLGLARSMFDSGSGRELHWLMCNGICLTDRAASDTP